jgi:TetR/AcrR family transcriptional repressor of uid operon
VVDTDRSGGASVAASSERPTDIHSRIYEAALRCFARQGVTKSSIEEIANLAGCSRATVYRHFKGKEAIVAGAIRWEAAKFFSALRQRLDGVRTFEELFVQCALTADEFIGGHRVIPAIIEGEPELLLPHVALDAPLVVRVSTEFLTPFVERLMLRRDIDRDDPSEVAEWIVRSVLSFLLVPSLRFDLGSEEDMLRLAKRYLAPSLRRSRIAQTG